ncbi:hypothetical protein NGF19_25385 [Streptomyces sp. RY43-2]|uniref:Uncharacterized protein n=1 Tax=Streptomyces macrolidinus TaxID=2952607 RepID=A0ABT0ZKJ1_9ACTN|nr:hypothetical protein [Streptomyces macrolidinus]MCN9244073.1 hypothetical protein [Streptomyces macrolidinus]
MVRANLAAGHRRLGAAAVPLALTVAVAAVALLVPQMKWRELDRQDHGRLTADYLVEATGKGPPGTAARRVGELPGVATAVSALST